jgi:hypothetical protein
MAYTFAQEMNPMQQYNKYSCGLASVVYEANRGGMALSQEGVVRDFQSHFPIWANCPGMVQPSDILHLLTLLGLKAADFIATKNIYEARKYFIERDPYAGFVWIRRLPNGQGATKANDHCMVFRQFTRDEGLLVMDPATAQERNLTSKEFQLMDATILLCSEHTQNKAHR